MRRGWRRDQLRKGSPPTPSRRSRSEEATFHQAMPRRTERLTRPWVVGARTCVAAGPLTLAREAGRKGKKFAAAKRKSAPGRRAMRAKRKGNAMAMARDDEPHLALALVLYDQPQVARQFAIGATKMGLKNAKTDRFQSIPFDPAGRNPGVMAQHIGIVACSSEGAALCYRTLCLEAATVLGRYGHPEVSMHTPSLAQYVQCLDRADWRGVGALMLASADKLAKIGADFLICPDNTIHQALPHIEARLPRPWLHIAEAVADAAVARGFRRLGLTGTRWLVDSAVYPERLRARGLEWVLPSPDERKEINRIIMNELVCGVVNPGAVTYIERVIARLQAQRCDAVVLGCTELPLIINDANSVLPTLDSTRLLARAAVDRAARGAGAAA